MRDIWTTRDLPVLRAYVELENADDDISNANDDVAAELGMTLDELDRSLSKLDQAEYIHTRATFGGVYVTGVTERRLREVGAWPSEQTALDRMLEALESIAEHTDDEDTRTRARKIIEGLSGAGRQLGLSVAAAVVTGQMPGQ